MSIGERDIIAERGKRLMKRKHRPHHPSCPMHLRRICGVCTSFPADAQLRAKGQRCSRLGIAVSGGTCAARCEFWARKSAPIDCEKETE